MGFSTDHTYRKFLVTLAQSSILNSCLLFSTSDYYSKRSEIDQRMTADMVANINATSVGVSVEYFQLINIAFPASYNDLILQKQTSEQLEVTLTNDRLNQVTKANTEFYVANNTANIKIIQGRQTAATILNEAATTQAVVESFWLSRAEAYGAIMSNFEYTNVSQLVDYINSESIRNSYNLVTGIK